MKVSYSDNIGNTPAIVYRDTGEIVLNKSVWPRLPQAYRRFVLGHEIGHFALQTTNELEADHYAFNLMAGAEKGSLKNMVKTLADVLPFTTELQKARLLNLYRLALCYDQAKKPDQQRATEIKRMELSLLQQYKHIQQLQDYMITNNSLNYEFPGYSPENFSPSVGRWFHDVPVPKVAEVKSQEYVSDEKPWPAFPPEFIRIMDLEKQFSSVDPSVINQIATKTITNPSVPVEMLPDYELPLQFRIEFKSVAIGILLVLAFIGIQKL